jgi:hypothetical protein
VPFGAFGFGEEPELFGAGEVIEQDLALAGRDLVGLVVGDEGRAADLGRGVGVGVAEDVGEVGPTLVTPCVAIRGARKAFTAGISSRLAN